MNTDIRTIRRSLAPAGTLRVGINVGNPVLASGDAGGALCGVSVDLARELAGRLGVQLKPIVFSAAGLSVQALANGHTDLGFFAVDPARSMHVSFTRPYLLIEGAYLVRQESRIHATEQVDQPGNRVVVGKASAYDLFLSRELESAELIRISNSQAVVNYFLSEGYEVAAGVRQQLQFDEKLHAGLRLLDKSFMLIRQAMGVSSKNPCSVVDYLNAFIRDVISSGFVAGSLKANDINGVSIASD